MQPNGPSLPLNGVRAFEAAARFRSIKAAADALGVTPGAVSHQIKRLETVTGTRLFHRRNNGLDLTPDGASFFADVSPALAAIARAAAAVRRDGQQVALTVSPSLALRWLIPRLGRFHQDHPGIRVSVETCRLPIVLAPGVDIAISYARDGAAGADGTLLLPDLGLPVASAQIVRLFGGGRAEALHGAPMIAATVDEWDVRTWAQAQGIDPAGLRIAGRFDTDQAALQACIAGLGVCIASRFMIETELRTGALMPFGAFPDHRFGSYRLIVARPARHAVRVLAAWLLNAAAPARAQQSAMRTAARA